MEESLKRFGVRLRHGHEFYGKEESPACTGSSLETTDLPLGAHLSARRGKLNEQPNTGAESQGSWNNSPTLHHESRGRKVA
jgi:hypothetical protein